MCFSEERLRCPGVLFPVFVPPLREFWTGTTPVAPPSPGQVSAVALAPASPLDRSAGRSCSLLPAGADAAPVAQVAKALVKGH